MVEQLLELDKVLTLWINGSHQLYLDGFFMTITATSTWLPLIPVLLYVLIRNNDFRHLGFILLFLALSILLADQVASGIFKPLVKRFRPTQDPEIMYALDVVNGYRGGLYGFFSSHAANTFSISAFLSLLIRRRSLTLILLSWAVLNSWSRAYLGVHYLGDLLVGMVWGLTAGGLMYVCYAYATDGFPRSSSANRSSIYTTTHYRIAEVDVLTGAFLLVYLFVAFKSLFFF